MSVEPEPLQRLLLWRLAVSEDGGEFLKNVEAKLDPAKRRALIREGLITEGKRKPSGGGRGVTYLELTEKGWAWCQTNLDAELKTRSSLAVPVLQRLLARLKNFFENQDQTVSFGQLIQQSRPKAVASPDDSPAGNGRVADLERAIRETCLELGAGRENVRVRLSELRVRMNEVPGPLLDGTLLEMERAGKLSLYSLDNPQEIRPEDRGAALRTAAGNERHIVYFGGRAS